MGKRTLAAAVFLGILTTLPTVDAQVGSRRLTIDDIYGTRRINFSGTPETGITWIDPSTYLTRRRAATGVEWLKVDAASGRTSPLFDAGPVEAALASLPGITRDEAAQLARSGDVILNPARTGALLTIADDLYFHAFGSARADRLTTQAGEEEVATFSPDGRTVAFVRSNNLYVVDIVSQREQAITTDGSPDRLNGKLDWLYQEEIYGRGQFKGYWWSPDSTRLAFLQLDEQPVPEYTVVDHIPYRPALEVTDYPKAGDPNPTVKLGLARVAGGGPSWVDLGDYSAIEFLIVNVGWTPDSQQVVHQVQDREQTWLDLRLADVSDGHGQRAVSRDDARVGQRKRQPGVAQRRVLPLVQRTQRLQASVSIQRGRGDDRVRSRPGAGKCASCLAWTRRTASRTSRLPSGIRLLPTSSGFVSTAAR